MGLQTFILIYVFYKGLPSTDSDHCPQGGEKKFDIKQEYATDDVPRGDLTCTTLNDENNNNPKVNPATMKTAANEVAISATTAEPLLANEESSSAEKTQTETIVASHDANESMGSSFGQQITAASSTQGIEPEGQNNLPERNIDEEVTEPVSKCKYK